MRGLKPPGLSGGNIRQMSHLSQVRGLKQIDIVCYVPDLVSHLSQVRGLKPAPALDSTSAKVAPFTGAWIETPPPLRSRRS